MATPLYDALVAKVRDWSNKPEVNTIPTSVIQDCLKYSADECYRLLRIPPLEETVTYTVSSNDNTGTPSAGDYLSYTSFPIPEDLTQFIYLRTVDSATQQTTMFNEVTDKRTFFDPLAETYGDTYWMWQDGKIFVKPQLAVGTKLEVHYYKRLPSLNALYSVIPINYIIGLSDANQPYLTLVVSGGTNLYFSTANSITKCFSSFAEAEAYNPTVTTKMYTGNEVSNWLRDQNERLLIWGGLYNLGAYLVDDVMEKRYQVKFIENINSLNKEEKWRRSLGGNVQMNFNTGGLI
jgi:hypothetical protein